MLGLHRNKMTTRLPRVEDHDTSWLTCLIKLPTHEIKCSLPITNAHAWVKIAERSADNRLKLGNVWNGHTFFIQTLHEIESTQVFDRTSWAWADKNYRVKKSEKSIIVKRFL